jgi:hypothetical protein
MNSSLNIHHWSALRALRTHFRFPVSSFRFLLLAALFATAATARASAPATDLPPVDHYVYLSQLPHPEDLMHDAAANGLTITRLDQTADHVVVTYQYADGHIATLGYALLGAAGTRSNPIVLNSPAPAAHSSAQVSQVDGGSTVVVHQDPQVVYVDHSYPAYYGYPYYGYPYYGYWAPLTVGIGIGWSTAYYGGGHYHGGYYGGHSHGGGGYHGGGGHGGGGHH